MRDSPLHVAVRRRHLQAVQKLLQYGATVTDEILESAKDQKTIYQLLWEKQAKQNSGKHQQ